MRCGFSGFQPVARQLLAFAPVLGSALLLALIVTLLGAAAGQHTFAGAGIAFLAVFVTAYFYGMETTLLTKSITLVATGAAVLVARWILLLFVRDRHAGDTHA